MIPRKVVIRGAGDLATGVAHRLWHSGFLVIMLELPGPLVVRRNVAFASAVYEGSIEVENVRAELCPSPAKAGEYLERRVIPVLIDGEAKSLAFLEPSILIDAIMAKRNQVTIIDQADLTIGLGPGFTAGNDVHVVIETERGHNLGRVIHSGSAAEDTTVPGKISGYGIERLLRAPAGGIFRPVKEIGDTVGAGETVAFVDDRKINATISGLVRGMLYGGTRVAEGMKVGDIDPRGATVNYHLISDKARAVGGGVLEAILNRYFRKP